MLLRSAGDAANSWPTGLASIIGMGGAVGGAAEHDFLHSAAEFRAPCASPDLASDLAIAEDWKS